MAKLIEELSNQELEVLKSLCDIFNVSREADVKELAREGIQALKLFCTLRDPKEIAKLVRSEMRGRGLPVFN